MKNLRTPFIEPLEARIAPAGVVNVSFSNGVLVIAGDEAANSVTITQTSSESFEITGQAGTTLNDATTAMMDFEGAIGKLRIDAGAGSDMFTFQDVRVTRALLFAGGEGSDTVMSTNLRVGGRAVFTDTTGDESVTFLGATAIGKNLSLSLGEGTNSLVVPGNDTVIGGSLILKTGNGDDMATFGNDQGNPRTVLTIAKNLTLNLGDGVNMANVAPDVLHVGGRATVTHGDSLAAAGSTMTAFAPTDGQIDGKLKITAVTGGDTVTLATDGRFTLHGVSISTGSGLDNIAISGTRVTTGRMTIATGDDADTIAISPVAGDFGVLKVLAGTGDDNIVLPVAGQSLKAGKIALVLEAGNDTVTGSAAYLGASRNFRIDGAAGDDQITLTGLFTEVGGAFRLDGGEGINNVTISPDQFRVGGALSIIQRDHAVGSGQTTLGSVQISAGSLSVIHMAGEDNVTVGAPATPLVSETIAVRVAGAIRLNTGPGNDTLSFNGQVIEAGGGVKIKGGTGNDTIMNMSEFLSARSLSVRGGEGVDNVSFTTNGAILGNTRIQLGAGDGTVSLQGVAGTGAGFSIRGKLVVSIDGSATATDRIQLSTVAVAGIARITAGAGASTVDIDDFHAGRSFKLNTGVGADTVRIEQDTTAPGTDSVFRGNTRIRTGEGVDTVMIGLGTDNNRAEFVGRSFFADGGEGSDTINDVDAMNMFGPGTTSRVVNFEVAPVVPPLG